MDGSLDGLSSRDFFLSGREEILAGKNGHGVKE